MILVSFHNIFEVVFNKVVKAFTVRVVCFAFVFCELLVRGDELAAVSYCEVVVNLVLYFGDGLGVYHGNF